MRAVAAGRAACVLAALLAGCSTGSIGMRKDLDQQHFEVGKTSRAEVVNAIGLPQRMEKDAAGNEHYYYERSARLTGMCVACGMANNTGGFVTGSSIESSRKNAITTSIEFVFSSDGTLISGQ